MVKECDMQICFIVILLATLMFFNYFCSSLLIKMLYSGGFATQDGNAVAWHNWRFRIGFTPREGLVLNSLSIFDQDKLAVRMVGGFTETYSLVVYCVLCVVYCVLCIVYS